jgi:hypothetical protein
MYMNGYANDTTIPGATTSISTDQPATRDGFEAGGQIETVEGEGEKEEEREC